MKMIKLIALVVMLFAVVSFAQTGTRHSGGSSVYYTLTAMADSTGSFYSQWIDISEFLPAGDDTLVIPVIAVKSSTNATAYVQGQLQGRLIGSINSDPVLLDSLSGFWNSEATTAKYLLNIGKYKVSQVRWHLDGLAGNRADANVKLWMNLIKR